MKKIYLGSNKLQNNFKMFRMEKIKSGVMQLMNGYLQKYGGKLINVVDLQNCNQLLVYFVTGSEVPHPDWDNYLKNTLLKNYNIIAGSIELGPRPG